MATNQEAQQASLRAITGTSYFFNDDWLAYLSSAGFTTGTINDRMLAWLNSTMGTSYQFLADAQRAYAVSNGVSNWNELGTLTLIPNNSIVQRDGSSVIDRDGAYIVTR